MSTGGWSATPARCPAPAGRPGPRRWSGIPRSRLLAFLLLLFPHGRLPSRRWRPFAWFVVAVYLTLSLSAAAGPGAVELYYPEAAPPVRLPAASLADIVFGWLLPGQLLLLGVALVSVVLRLRRAAGRGAPAGQVVRVHGGDGDPGVRRRHPGARRWVLFPCSA